MWNINAKRVKGCFPLGEFLRANMKGRHCIGLNWRNLQGYVSLNQYNVFLSYSREEIRLVESRLKVATIVEGFGKKGNDLMVCMRVLLGVETLHYVVYVIRKRYYIITRSKQRHSIP